MTSKYIPVLLTLISILCFAFINNKVKPINEPLDFKKYEIESAKVKYIVKENDIAKCTLEVMFFNYGATESISIYSTADNDFKFLSVKQDSIQTNFFKNNSMPLVQQRKNEYLIESLVSNKSFTLFEGIRLHKKRQKRYLKNKCDHFDFKLTRGNNLIDGEITYYKGLPLFVKGGIENTETGKIELYEINAIKFEEK